MLVEGLRWAGDGSDAVSSCPSRRKRNALSTSFETSRGGVGGRAGRFAKEDNMMRHQSAEQEKSRSCRHVDVLFKCKTHTEDARRKERRECKAEVTRPRRACFNLECLGRRVTSRRPEASRPGRRCRAPTPRILQYHVPDQGVEGPTTQRSRAEGTGTCARHHHHTRDTFLRIAKSALLSCRTHSCLASLPHIALATPA